MEKNRFLKILNGFKKAKVAVIGDFIADEYIMGITSRISREAPVLVLKYDSRVMTMGGAGNAVNNLRDLGATVYPLGSLGDDPTGRELIALMRSKGIDTDGVILDRNKISSTKTRILAGGENTTKQQVIRIDREVTKEIDKHVEEKLIDFLGAKFKEIDALLISDYSLGTITPRVLNFINKLSRKREKIITLDSRFNILQFKNITVATPNSEEMEWAVKAKLNAKNVRSSCQKMLRAIKSEAVLLTQGKEGMSLLEKNGDFTHVDIYGTEEIADVTGAGDTVISTFTLSLCAGATLPEATVISNYAGGIVVGKRGTATVSNEELQRVM